jgi:hypothetical protein
MITANHATRAHGAPTTPPLRHLRQVLHPDYAMLPHAELCELMDEVYGPDAAERYDEYLEGIFGSIGKAFSSAARDVGRFAAKAAPAIATVGGGVLQGAMAGSALGLPGIIAGAAAGGVGAGLSKYGSGAARSVGNVLSGVTSVAGQFSPAGRVGASLGGAVSGLASGRNGAGAAINALGGLVGGRAGSAAAGALGALASGRGIQGAALGALGSIAGGAGGGRGLPGAALGALGSLAGGRGASGRGGAAMNALGALTGGSGSALGALGALAGGGKSGSPLGALTSLFGGTSAAGQLQSLLQRPETQRALAAINLGPLGRPSIPTGSGRTPIPVGAITNLIGQLSNQAAAEAAAFAGDGESTLHYMTDQYGEFVGDPAVESDRGERVWELLNEAHAERVLEAVVHYSRARAEYIERMHERAEAAEDAEDADSYYGTEEEFYEAMAEASASPLYFDNAGESEYFQ